MLGRHSLGRHQYRPQDKNAVLPQALEQPAVFFYHGPHALQAQTVALPLGDRRQTVRPEVHRLWTGITHRKHEPLVFGQLQGELDIAQILWLGLAGVDGVFQGIAQNHTQVRLFKGEVFRGMYLGVQGAAGVFRLNQIGHNDGVQSGIGALGGIGQVVQAAAEGTDVMLCAVQVPLLEQSAQRGQVVAHIMAVDSAKLHFLTDRVVVPVLKLKHSVVLVHFHLLP